MFNIKFDVVLGYHGPTLTEHPYNRVTNWFVTSEKTVNDHCKHIYTKLGVHSRTEVTAKAFKEGLLPFDNPPHKNP